MPRKNTKNKDTTKDFSSRTRTRTRTRTWVSRTRIRTRTWAGKDSLRTTTRTRTTTLTQHMYYSSWAWRAAARHTIWRQSTRRAELCTGHHLLLCWAPTPFVVFVLVDIPLLSALGRRQVTQQLLPSTRRNHSSCWCSYGPAQLFIAVASFLFYVLLLGCLLYTYRQRQDNRLQHFWCTTYLRFLMPFLEIVRSSGKGKKTGKKERGEKGRERKEREG